MNPPDREIDFLLVGNPRHDRVAQFQEALRHLEMPPARVISYEHILESREDLRDHVTPQTVIRIESPGECTKVERLLISMGEDAAEPAGSHISAEEAMHLPEDLGGILYPAQWFRGFRRAMADLSQQMNGVAAMNHPEDIVLMFDKPSCHQLLQSHGISVPASLEKVQNYDDLIGKMAEAGWNRVFVKLASGSSASGAIAYERGRWGQAAWSTMEPLIEHSIEKFYNSKRVRRYRDEATIRRLIDFVCAEGAHVEEWWPKAAFRGLPFDLRLVIINSRLCHSVVRMSRSPMTNLHLGNRRGEGDTLREALPDEIWAGMRRTCLAADALFTRSFYTTMDLLFIPGFKRHAILEMNAFGDWLKRTSHEGRDTYTQEILAWMATRRSMA